VERPGDELAPEGAEFGERPCCTAGRRARERCRDDGSHDAASVFDRGFAAKNAVFDAENEFWPDLLKDGFNCRDLTPTWYRSRIHPW